MRAFNATAVSLILLSASVAAAERAYVEGYVYNKLTGVPVTAATVSLTDLSSIVAVGMQPPVATVVRSTLSDGNGFYSIEVDLEPLGRSSLVTNDLAATCHTRNGTSRTNRWSTRVHLRPGTIRRDLFIEGLPNRRVATHCGLRPFLQPLVPSVPVPGR